MRLVAANGPWRLTHPRQPPRFEVWDFFAIDGVSPPLSANPSRTEGHPRPEQSIACAEELLRLLLTVVSAREYVGVVTPAQRLDLCLAHFLAGADSRKHSQIMLWASCSPACLREGALHYSEVCWVTPP